MKIITSSKQETVFPFFAVLPFKKDTELEVFLVPLDELCYLCLSQEQKPLEKIRFAVTHFSDSPPGERQRKRKRKTKTKPVKKNVIFLGNVCFYLRKI